jgi:putative membrane protein
MRSGKWAVVAVVVAACVMGGCASKPKVGATTKTAAGAGEHDKRFLKNATLINLYQIEAGRVATAKAKSDRVRNVARLLQRDHEELAGKMAALARQHKIALPAEQDPQYAELLARFDHLSGQDFEREFLNQQVKMHEDAESVYVDEANHGEDPGVRALAQETLPDIYSHKRHVMALRPGTWRPATVPR